MTRYFFNIRNGHPYDDQVGEELATEARAWEETVKLTRDIETSLQPGSTWSVEVKDDQGPIYAIEIQARRLR